MIEIFNDVIDREDNDKLYEELLRTRHWIYGETDSKGLPPVGMSCNLKEEYKEFFLDLIVDRIPLIKDMVLRRAYVNLIQPSDRAYFHQDGQDTTVLFYINPETDIQEGGETQFIVDDNIFGLLPKPCQMVMFDGTILHKATSFRTIPRITAAFKFYDEI